MPAMRVREHPKIGDWPPEPGGVDKHKAGARPQESEIVVEAVHVEAVMDKTVPLTGRFLIGANPVRETRAEGRRTDPERYAYTFKEVLYMLKKLPEPARTVVATAAFSGLRESELRGLQWPDYDSQFLFVRRSVWRTHIGDTKTPESRARVPVIAPLRKALDAHRKRDGANNWIFSGEKMGRPLHLDNLSRRVIKPILKSRWKGWHAFRRGLATNLYDLGVPAEVAQLILRHANVSTTREHYLVLESRGKSAAAMRTLERALAKK